MRFRSQSGAGRSQGGYMLLMLMLAVALMAIAAVAIAPTLAFQAKRDREEELIHRGVQYSRAVRRYYKKFGRYPTRVEDLENTNNLRFLRKRYKDPITGQDFKLLHFGEVQMAMGGGIMGGVSPGTAIGNGPAGTTQTSQSGQFSTNGPGGGTQSSGFSLGPSNSGGAQNSQTNQAQAQGAPATDSDANSSSANTTGSDSSSPNSPGGTNGSQGSGQSPGQGSGQTFGGGPIVGVVSASKLATIREFNNKNHYNQWQFIYDPGTDRGGLLNTPAQPALQNAVAMQPGGNGAPGANGMTGAPGGFGAQGPGGAGSGMVPFGQQTPSPMQNQPQPPSQPTSPMDPTK